MGSATAPTAPLHPLPPRPVAGLLGDAPRREAHQPRRVPGQEAPTYPNCTPPWRPAAAYYTSHVSSASPPHLHCVPAHARNRVGSAAAPARSPPCLTSSVWPAVDLVLAPASSLVYRPLLLRAIRVLSALARTPRCSCAVPVAVGASPRPSPPQTRRSQSGGCVAVPPPPPLPHCLCSSPPPLRRHPPCHGHSSGGGRRVGRSSPRVGGGPPGAGWLDGRVARRCLCGCPPAYRGGGNWRCRRPGVALLSPGSCSR